MSSYGCVVPIRASAFDFFLEFSFGDSERLEQKFNADTQYLYYIKKKLRNWVMFPLGGFFAPYSVNTIIIIIRMKVL
jgi:hypothetical protein